MNRPSQLRDIWARYRRNKLAMVGLVVVAVLVVTAIVGDYLTPYDAFEQNLSRTRAIWTSMAKNPTTRPGLDQSCALARDSAKVSMQPYRCDW